MNTQALKGSGRSPRRNQAKSDGKRISIGKGFSAKSYKHSDFAGLMDPLIMVDHFLMTEPTFGTHAHAGLSAVTVLFEDSIGAFRNRDSLGNDIDLAPGDLYWFKAARGAIHNEEPRGGARTHALQVFVNLPAEKRQEAPSAFHLAANDIPKIVGDRAQARVLLGESNGVKGAAAPDVSLTLLDLKIEAGGRFTHQGDSGRHAWILAVEGVLTISLGGEPITLLPGGAVAVADASDISFSSASGAHAALFQGEPLREAFIQRGPFAMSSEEELSAVEADFRAGRLGSID